LCQNDVANVAGFLAVFGGMKCGHALADQRPDDGKGMGLEPVSAPAPKECCHFVATVLPLLLPVIPLRLNDVTDVASFWR
jgi:hypothetical protein